MGDRGGEPCPLRDGDHHAREPRLYVLHLGHDDGTDHRDGFPGDEQAQEEAVGPSKGIGLGDSGQCEDHVDMAGRKLAPPARGRSPAEPVPPYANA